MKKTASSSRITPCSASSSAKEERPSSDPLQELWVEARIDTVERWTDRLLEVMGEVAVAIPPRPALLMMQVRDSVHCERFCVGEILVTECQILVRDERFWGRAVGNDPLRALALALVSAAELLAPDALARLEPQFEEERAFLLAERLRQARALGTTRVQFDTMA